MTTAARRFDEKRNFRFISYAIWWVRQAILRSLANNSRIFRLPIKCANIIYRLGKIKAQYEQIHNSTPSCSEIASELDVPENEVALLMNIALRPRSLDAPVDSEKDEMFIETIFDTSIEKPDDYTNRVTQTEAIFELLDILSAREKRIICLYYGIGKELFYTLEEIGKLLHISRERVRQIKDTALKKLQHSFKRFKLRD